MKKADIELAAMSGYGPYGSQLDGLDVARVSRDKRCVTLRHSWPENIDARIWAGVRREAWGLAQRIANETGRSVEIYTHDGITLDQIEPSE